MRTATVHAALGDGSAFGRSIAAAQREMDAAADHEPLAECPTWLRFVSHGEVVFHQARGFAFLGHAVAAVDAHGGALALHASPRNAAGYRAQRASALARVGELSAAVQEATPVLEQLADGVSSPRVLGFLGPVRRAVENRPGADTFTEHYDAVAARLAVAV
jgi:hypothetical protein